MNHEAFNPRLSADIDGHAMRTIDEGVCDCMVTPGTICDYSPCVQQRAD